MRSCVAATLATLAVAVLSGCDSAAAPTSVVPGTIARFDVVEVDFGRLQTGVLDTRTVRIHNDGTAVADFSTLVGLTDGMTARGAQCLEVAPGGSCEMTLRYRGTQPAELHMQGVVPLRAQHSNELQVRVQTYGDVLDSCGHPVQAANSAGYEPRQAGQSCP